MKWQTHFWFFIAFIIPYIYINKYNLKHAVYIYVYILYKFCVCVCLAVTENQFAALSANKITLLNEHVAEFSLQIYMNTFPINIKESA